MADSYALPDAPQESGSKRQKVEEALASIRGVIKASWRPLPAQTGDGTYIVPPRETGFFHDILTTRIQDVATLFEAKMAEVKGDPVDDKTYLMERIIQVDDPVTNKAPCPAKFHSTVQQQTPVHLGNGEEIIRNLYQYLVGRLTPSPTVVSYRP